MRIQKSNTAFRKGFNLDFTIINYVIWRVACGWGRELKDEGKNLGTEKRVQRSKSDS